MNTEAKRMAKALRELYEDAKQNHRRCRVVGRLNGRLVRCTRSEFHPTVCELSYE